MKKQILLIITLMYGLGLYAGGQESGTFTDKRDGQIYRWVRIREQVWMAENLNYATNSGSWCYDNQSGNCSMYGRLYNWQTAMNACPPGWYLPGDAGWTKFTDSLGNNPGARLKAQSGWAGNGNGTDDCGFSALPGGYRNGNGDFNDLGYDGGWWTADEHSQGYAYYRAMGMDYSDVDRYHYGKEYGFSVRCVRNVD